jgi:hypothetical protein
MKNFFPIIAILLVLAVFCEAQIPRTLSYQGVLTDSLGNPKPDNSYEIMFILWDSQVNGKLLWLEHTYVQTKRGLFSAQLGNVNPFPDSVKFDIPYWLGIQVGNDPELSPRVPLTAVGYSLNSIKSDTAKYAFNARAQIFVDSARIATTVPDNSLSGSKIANSQIVRSINSIKDNVTLTTQGGATITSSNDTIIINAGIGGGGTGIQGVQNTNNTLDIVNPTGPTATINVKDGVFLKLSGGTMTGAISNTGDPSITMGKGNFGMGNTNSGTDAFVAGRNNQATGNYSVISGGGNENASFANTASGEHSTVSGGKYNRALAKYSTVSGGQWNRVDSTSSVISGGEYNRGSNILIAIGGGTGNTASGQIAAVSGGMTNTASGNMSFVGGGSNNIAGGDGSAICGGGVNVTGASYSTVGGGNQNQATGGWSTVGGGKLNKARAMYSVVAGGGGNTDADSNSANGMHSFIGGGKANIISSPISVIAGGEHNTSTNSYTTIGGGSYHSATGQSSTIGGGLSNFVQNDFATIGGGSSNIASGVSSNISGGIGNFATGEGTTVGGGGYNKARGLYSVVGGGGGATIADSNSAIGDYSTVAGGSHNIARQRATTVGGGRLNRAEGLESTVSGGLNNNTSESYATVSGGVANRATGWSSTIPGGNNNQASGSSSFAAGYNANATHDGAFVWGDFTDIDITSDTTNQFKIRATNGINMASSAGASKKIRKGDYYSDNAIVAWGKVSGAGSISTYKFGVTSVVHNSTGNYTITVDVSTASLNSLVPVATVETDSPPTGASSMRFLTINQVTTSTFDVYITNGSFAATDNDFTFIVTGR